MKFTERIYNDCGGRCCICSNAMLCADGSNKQFEPIDKDTAIRRIDMDVFPFHDAFIVGYLFGKYGYRYGED